MVSNSVSNSSLSAMNSPICVRASAMLVNGNVPNPSAPFDNVGERDPDYLEWVIAMLNSFFGDTSHQQHGFSM